MEMANYILSILRTQICVVMSWGFHGAFVIENGLGFFVQGYLHKGRVEVIYDEGWDLFTVRTFKSDGGVKEQVEGIYLDGLVDCIDRLVEYCPNYKEKVRADYGFSNK